MLADCIPVIHLGQREAVDVIAGALPQVQWCRVYLWCPRDIAAERLIARRMNDLGERLRMWDATPPLASADLTFNTAVMPPSEVAVAIRSCTSS
jgi:guanylate kinase